MMSEHVYKWLRSQTGWPLHMPDQDGSPGKWIYSDNKSIDIEKCSDESSVVGDIRQIPQHLYLVEQCKEMKANKIITTKIRLVKRIGEITEPMLRLFAIDCAERLIHTYRYGRITVYYVWDKDITKYAEYFSIARDCLLGTIKQKAIEKIRKELRQIEIPDLYGGCGFNEGARAHLTNCVHTALGRYDSNDNPVTLVQNTASEAIRMCVDYGYHEGISCADLTLQERVWQCYRLIQHLTEGNSDVM